MAVRLAYPRLASEVNLSFLHVAISAAIPRMRVPECNSNAPVSSKPVFS